MHGAALTHLNNNREPPQGGKIKHIVGFSFGADTKPSLLVHIITDIHSASRQAVTVA